MFNQDKLMDVQPLSLNPLLFLKKANVPLNLAFIYNDSFWPIKQLAAPLPQ